MHEPPSAFISHKSGARIRLKFPSKKKDNVFFVSLAQEISGIEGLSSVETNPLTGSILLTHSSDPDRVIEMAEAAGLFRIVNGAEVRTNLHRRISDAFDGIDIALRGATGNELDAGGAAFLTLVGLGIYQIARGNAAAIPWYAAGWYALNIFLKSDADRQQPA